MDKKWMFLLAGVAVGLMAAPSLRKLPLVSKLPSF
jgi:hypothetical protein